MVPDVIRCPKCFRPGTIVYVSGLRILEFGSELIRVISYGCRTCGEILCEKETVRHRKSRKRVSPFDLFGSQAGRLHELGEWDRGRLIRPAIDRKARKAVE